MSGYNNTNTTILATHMDAGGNKRMLLAHKCESGRIEYVIGSYFQEKQSGRRLLFECHGCGNLERGEELVAYSWDWGHYFDNVVKAVDYWKREVLGEKLAFEDAMDRVCIDCAYTTGSECESCMVRKTHDQIG